MTAGHDRSLVWTAGWAVDWAPHVGQSNYYQVALTTAKGRPTGFTVLARNGEQRVGPELEELKTALVAAYRAGPYEKSYFSWG